MAGILNLRDIAQLTASDPRAPAPGRVFRSSQPFDWDLVATMEFLAGRGIETIVDLRSEREAGMVPWLVAADAGIDVVAAPLDPSEANPASTMGLLTAEDLGNYYVGWLHSRPGAVVSALEPIVAGRTTLVHCAAGKDRTGVITAVVLLVAGVSDELIIQDYAHTTGALPEILPALAKLWLGNAPSGSQRMSFDNPPVILTSPAAAMATFIDGLRREYGTVDAFLTGAGMDRHDLTRLRKTLNGQ
ncbi:MULTISPECIES: tyrosine-protein phosphatase [unclassified Arthrobacter]|uniref:tyrosine-protein phosphatase n=1 Tax=unclassified Arthrobacter TaxID=235627 RepID=UPI000306A0D0|nr:MULTISPECIES: tyrosine-protein phosphatase [unclassified Arthrobacter]PVE18793.1 protein-tyrosine-phosphatase [Arthrobacter sp. Bz4]